jgi:hypothetical protein
MNPVDLDQTSSAPKKQDRSNPSSSIPDQESIMLASTTASNEAFAEHLLSLLALVVPAPQPIHQDQDQQSPDPSTVEELLSHHLSRSNAELKVEKALLELGERLRNAELQLQMNGQKKDGMQYAHGDRYLMGKSRAILVLAVSRAGLVVPVLPFAKRSECHECC